MSGFLYVRDLPVTRCIPITPELHFSQLGHYLEQGLVTVSWISTWKEQHSPQLARLSLYFTKVLSILLWRRHHCIGLVGFGGGGGGDSHSYMTTGNDGQGVKSSFYGPTTPPLKIIPFCFLRKRVSQQMGPGDKRGPQVTGKNNMEWMGLDLQEGWGIVSCPIRWSLTSVLIFGFLWWSSHHPDNRDTVLGGGKSTLWC